MKAKKLVKTSGLSQRKRYLSRIANAAESIHIRAPELTLLAVTGSLRQSTSRRRRGRKWLNIANVAPRVRKRLTSEARVYTAEPVGPQHNRKTPFLFSSAPATTSASPLNRSKYIIAQFFCLGNVPHRRVPAIGGNLGRLRQRRLARSLCGERCRPEFSLPQQA